MRPHVVLYSIENFGANRISTKSVSCFALRRHIIDYAIDISAACRRIGFTDARKLRSVKECPNRSWRLFCASTQRKQCECANNSRRFHRCSAPLAHHYRALLLAYFQRTPQEAHHLDRNDPHPRIREIPTDLSGISLLRGAARDHIGVPDHECMHKQARPRRFSTCSDNEHFRILVRSTCSMRTASLTWLLLCKIASWSLRLIAGHFYNVPLTHSHTSDAIGTLSPHAGRGNSDYSALTAATAAGCSRWPRRNRARETSLRVPLRRSSSSA